MAGGSASLDRRSRLSFPGSERKDPDGRILILLLLKRDALGEYCPHGWCRTSNDSSSQQIPRTARARRRTCARQPGPAPDASWRRHVDGRVCGPGLGNRAGPFARRQVACDRCGVVSAGGESKATTRPAADAAAGVGRSAGTPGSLEFSAASGPTGAGPHSGSRTSFRRAIAVRAEPSGRGPGTGANSRSGRLGRVVIAS